MASNIKLWTPLDNLHKFYRYLPKYPMQWDPKERKMVASYSDNRWKMIPWILILYGQGLICGSGTYAALFFKQLFTGVKKYSLTDISMMVSMGMWTNFMAACSIIVVMYAEEQAFAFNSLMKLEEELYTKTQHLLPKDVKRDKTGEMLNGIITQQASFPYLFSMGAVLGGKDPFYQALKFIWPRKFLKSFPMKIFRVISILPSGLEVMRATSLLTVTICLLVKLNLNCIKYLELRSSPSQYHRHISENISFYNKLQITMQSTEKGGGTLGCLGMSCAIMFTVSCCFTTLKLYDVLPIQLYIASFGGAIVNFMIMMLMMPITTNVHENSKVLVRNWMMNVIRLKVNQKYYRRLVASVGKPLTVSVSFFDFTLFPMRRKTKLTYLEANLHYTITALMTEESIH